MLVLKEKYPMSRDDMTEEQEKNFVNDCFDLYENEGFSKTFRSTYDSLKKYNGQTFKVLRRVAKGDDVDLCTLPIWEIQLENEEKIFAYHEEIIPSEMGIVT